MKKVLLIHPGEKEKFPRSPFPLLTLAAYLREKGIPCEIIDTRVMDWYHINLKNYFAVGIHIKTGELIKSAVMIAKVIKKKHPRLPLIWGGPHASFYPEQTIQSDLVDFVVRNEGEETLFELVTAIQNTEDLSQIKGLTYKSDGLVVTNVAREDMNLDDCPLPAYDLVDMKLYMDRTNLLQYETSRGCPHRCAFCYNSVQHHACWHAKSNEKVVLDIQAIKKLYKSKSFFFTDDNFFVNKERALSLCHLFIEKKLNIKWFSQIRADYLRRYSDDDLQLIKDSGAQFLEIGAESGSQRVLDRITKDISVDDIRQAAKRISTLGITPVFSFIIGFPWESNADLKKTVNLFLELNAMENVQINGLYLFTPYPGNRLFSEVILLGYRPKSSLEAWGDWTFNSPENMPWLSQKKRQKLSAISSMVLLNFVYKRGISYGFCYRWKRLGLLLPVYELGTRLLKLDSLLRMSLGLYSHAPEFVFFDKVASEKFYVR